MGERKEMVLCVLVLPQGALLRWQRPGEPERCWAGSVVQLARILACVPGDLACELGAEIEASA